MSIILKLHAEWQKKAYFDILISMLKNIQSFFVMFFLFLFCCNTVAQASLFEPNNKFGIGIAVPEAQDIKDAALLVNGNGGSWGYTTLVIQEDNRDINKWQGVCNTLRSNRLIPIFRLATKLENSAWRRPDAKDAIEWATFLKKLNCTTENTYIVLFNEPNHATEWGGAVDPKNYADTMLFFARTLKNTNPNFFIMLAGLDQAAPQQPPTYNDAGQFWREVLTAQPAIFDYVDGLASHCYPNPGFSASPTKRGRNSIGCYDWELSFLSGLGVSKELPVFITETGWVNGVSDLSEKYKTAYEQLWLPDGRVRAVTPFIINYMGSPFEQFSWKKQGASIQSDENGNPFFDHYYVIKDLKKVQGQPPQINKVHVLSPLPVTLIQSSQYQFQLWLRNAGQSIWHKPDGYAIDFIEKPDFTYSFSALYNIEPNDSGIINLDITTRDSIGEKKLTFGLFRNGELKATLFPWSMRIINPPPIKLHASVFPGREAEGMGELQLFDSQNNIVFKEKNVQFINGVATVPSLKNVSLGVRYRAVLIMDFYLPRQEFITIEDKNSLVFQMLIPGDANNDGTLSIEDIFLMPVNKTFIRSYLPKLFQPSFPKFLTLRGQ